MSVGFLIALAAIAIINVLIGWRWSRLDHNPWIGRPFGGTFSTFAPGFAPARLTVAEINQRGRQQMLFSPIATLVFMAILVATHHIDS